MMQNDGGNFGNMFGKKIIMTIFGVLLVYLVFFVGTLIHNNIKKYFYIGLMDRGERAITVNGYGKMNGKNDIAVTTIGYTNTDPDVGKAQADNKKVMDQVLADLKKMGVADKDLESNYSIYPQYDYSQTGSQFKGYQVQSSVTVKIRNLTLVPAALGLAGKYGANSVGGLSFTMDDTQALRALARGKAVADAKAKAAALAKSLGVSLVEVIAYNEFEGPQITPYPMANNFGMGGATEMKAEPAIASGSQEVEVNASITYKIVPAY